MNLPDLYSFCSGWLPALVVIWMGWKKYPMTKYWISAAFLAAFFSLILVYTGTCTLWELLRTGIAVQPTINLHLFGGQISRAVYLMNLLMLIPAGLMIPMLFRKMNLWKTACSGFCFSLAIEISQLAMSVRVTDLDDLLLNTAGCLCGALLWRLFLGDRKGKLPAIWLLWICVSVFAGRFFLLNELGAARLLYGF